MLSWFRQGVVIVPRDLLYGLQKRGGPETYRRASASFAAIHAGESCHFQRS